MILFADLPDELSFLINEYAQGQLWRDKFNEVIKWIQKPTYKRNTILRRMLMRHNKLYYECYFYLKNTGLCWI